MRVLGNIVWFLLGGFLISFGYILGGAGLCLTIVGIPFGIESIKLGVACIAPFGKEVVERPRANSPLRVIFNVLWLLLFGWGIALSHLILGVLLLLTLVGIPFGMQHIKLVPLALLPFGRDLEPVR